MSNPIGSNRYRDNNNYNKFDNTGGNPWKTRDNRNRRHQGNKQRPNRYQANNRRLDTRSDNRGSNADRWFKVTVAHCANLEHFYIVNQIRQNGIEFTPFNYSLNGNAVEFYVQGDDLALSIKHLSRRISVPDGNMKLNIAIEQTNLPPIECTNDFIEKLKIVMSNRYDVAEKSLNLSSLYNDQEFLKMHLFVSLSRINVCKEAVKVIIENIPDLKHLNLSSNKIQNLEPFKQLVSSCKNLKKIDLTYNNVSILSILVDFLFILQFVFLSYLQINNIDHLDNLKGLDLEELFVDYNPFKKNYKDNKHETFVR